MTRRNIVFWAVLLVLVTALVVVLYRASHAPGARAKRDLAHNRAIDGDAVNHDALGPPDASSIGRYPSRENLSARAGEDGVTGDADKPDGPTDSITIPNEHVLRFYNRADQEAFLRLAKKLGADVLGKMQFGNAIRIRIDYEALLNK